MIIAFLNNLFNRNYLTDRTFSIFLKTKIEKLKLLLNKSFKVYNNEVRARLMMSFWYSILNFEQILCYGEFWCQYY